MVMTERAADDSLLHLCDTGQAQESPHMRQACMQAVIDRASPACMRSITRGSYMFINEMGHVIAVPFNSVGLMGVVCVFGLLPWIGLVRSAFIRSAQTATQLLHEHPPEHTVVILNGDRSDGFGEQSVRRRIASPPTLGDESNSLKFI